MKTQNILLSSITALTLIVPALADNEQPNIAVGTNPAECNESVLETTSGTSNLEANWNANTLYLSWSVDGQPYATNDSNAAACTYDQGITIPTNPTKTGYTFAGWRVVTAAAPQQTSFDLSTLLPDYVNTPGSAYGYINDSSGAYGARSSNANTYGLTEDNTWATEFSYGTVYGEASCNGTNNPAAAYIIENTNSVLNGDMSGEAFIYGLSQVATQEETTATVNVLQQYQAGTPTYNEDVEVIAEMFRTNAQFSKNSSGQYCWCKATGYTPINGTKQSVGALRWAFGYNYNNAALCARECASGCGKFVREIPGIRAAVFNSAQ